MPGNGRVLVVDDDIAVRTTISKYLSNHGYDVGCAADGQAMRSEIERTAPDLVVLDLKLPGEDGLTLARFLREHYDMGIIMVTGSGDVVDRVVGLEVGADDYLAKPFDPRELLARVRSVMRRMQARPPAGAVAVSPTARSPATQRVAIGRCVLDLRSRQLFDRDGNEVPLTSMEYDLLKTFAAHPNQVLSRDRLLQLTRNRDWEPFDRSIDIRITRLRRKVEEDPENPRTIRTVRGAGYMFVPIVSAV